MPVRSARGRVSNAGWFIGIADSGIGGLHRAVEGDLPEIFAREERGSILLDLAVGYDEPVLII